MGICGRTLKQVDENVFKTDAYKMGQYEGRIRRQLPNLKLGVHSYDKKLVKIKMLLETFKKQMVFFYQDLDYQRKPNGNSQL